MTCVLLAPRLFRKVYDDICTLRIVKMVRCPFHTISPNPAQISSISHSVQKSIPNLKVPHSLQNLTIRNLWHGAVSLDIWLLWRRVWGNSYEALNSLAQRSQSATCATHSPRAGFYYYLSNSPAIAPTSYQLHRWHKTDLKMKAQSRLISDWKRSYWAPSWGLRERVIRL